MIKVTLITNAGRDSVIVSEDTTLREVLEDNDVNYSVGVTQLDGYSLKPGELDKSFEEMGILEKCYLSVVVKADNAASVTVVGDAAVVTSAVKLEDLELAEKYRPEALEIRNPEDKKDVLFRVTTTKKSSGSINKFGASFSQTTDAAGRAQITVSIDRDDDVHQVIEDEMGAALLKLDEIEAGLGKALDSIRADQAKIKEHITIV